MFLRIILFVLTVPNCHSFLEIKLQPSKGKNATLVCRYPVEATTVIWTRVGIGTITSCSVPGTCLPLVNKRYHCSVSRLYSNITITDSRQSEDSGEWKCTVNDQYHSSVNLIVATLPSSFYFTNAPTTEVFITNSGLDLHARAVCVFPKLIEVSLYYMIKGDNSFNLFTKRKPDIYFADGSTQNCDKHEYIMLTQIRVQEDDFLDLTMLFRMQYTALTGEVIDSQTTAFVAFPGHPCQSKPCKNGGLCNVLSFSHYHCTCPARYTGKNCDVNVNPCVSNPCQNYGICHGNEDHYTFSCKCQDGYSGFTCQEKPETTSAAFHKGIQMKCQALLTISKYATEGTEGIMQCDFHIENSTAHVVWYNDRDPNISVCNYPGYCEFPNHQRYEAFINNRYSSFVISAASYYEDDGRWYCNVNGLASSMNFTVTSIPKDFRFTNPPISGVSIPDDGVMLNATAVCLYPKPSNATMLYRIKGDQHYNVFQRRVPVIEFNAGHSGNCLSHQSVMLVSNSLFNADFDFVMDTSVLFQFSYKLQSGIEKTTEDVVDVKFSSSREIRTSTSKINAKTEISTKTTASGNLQNKSSSPLENLLIPTVSILVILLVLATAFIVVCLCRKEVPQCPSIPYILFKNTESEMTSRYSDISLNTDKDSTRRNVYNTEENKPVEMNTQTHEILRNKSQEKNTQVEKLSQQEGVDAPKENNDNENVRRLKKRNHKPNSDPRNLQSSSKGTSIKKSGQQNINYQTNSSNRNISEQKPALRENTYPIPGQIPSHQNTAQTYLLSQSVPNEDLSTNTKTPPKHSTEETCKERREDSKNKNTCNDNKSSTGKQGEENQIKGKGKNRKSDESVERNMSNVNIHPNTSGINAENDLDVNKNKNRSTTFKYNDHGLSRGPNSMPALGPQGYQRETPKSNESTSPNNDDTNGQFSQENKTNKGPINTDKEGNREVNEGMRAKRYIPEQKSVLQDNKAHYSPGSISSRRTRAKSDFLSKSLSLPYGIRQPRTQDISAKDDLDFVKKMSPTFSNYNYDLYGASNSNSALISFGNKKKSPKNNRRASPRNDDTNRQISQENKTNIGPIKTEKEGNREVNEGMHAKRYIPERKPASHVNKVHTFPGSISSHCTSASSDFLSKSLSFLPYENRHPRTQDVTAKDDLDVAKKISPTFRNDSNSNQALISFGNKRKSPNNNDRASHSNDGSNKQFPQENYSVSGPTRNDKESNGEFNEGMSASKGSASEDTKGEAFE